MEPLNGDWSSTGSRVYGRVYDSTLWYQVWDSVYWHLLRQFDRLFVREDK